VRAIADWLIDLPCPAGVMACDDDRGLQVLAACRLVGLHVPDDIAVIGADNDEFLCDLSDPPLSSVDLGPERIGYAGAALLDRLMRGKTPPRHPVLLSPLGVVSRRSTDVLAIEDPELTVFIRRIRQHACDGVGIEDLVGHSRLSASTIRRRCVQLLGRTPKEEMTRVRIERAKTLLTTTDLLVADIAVRCGFFESKHLSRAFFVEVGMTPSNYRSASARALDLYHPGIRNLPLN
jgi:LacI family transcriptional regulator